MNTLMRSLQAPPLTSGYQLPDATYMLVLVALSDIQLIIICKYLYQFCCNNNMPVYMHNMLMCIHDTHRRYKKNKKKNFAIHKFFFFFVFQSNIKLNNEII